MDNNVDLCNQMITAQSFIMLDKFESIHCSKFHCQTCKKQCLLFLQGRQWKWRRQHLLMTLFSSMEMLGNTSMCSLCSKSHPRLSGPLQVLHVPRTRFLFLFLFNFTKLFSNVQLGQSSCSREESLFSTGWFSPWSFGECSVFREKLGQSHQHLSAFFSWSSMFLKLFVHFQEALYPNSSLNVVSSLVSEIKLGQTLRRFTFITQQFLLVQCGFEISVPFY